MSNYSNVILADNPQAYYRLDETGGGVAFDLTANGYNGTLSSGVTYSQVGALVDDSDTAIAFGARDTLSISYLLNPSTFSALTLEFWIKLTGGWQYVVVTADINSTILYLNGVVFTSGSGDEIVIDTDIFYAGAFVAGSLDEVAIYNYKLTAVDIAHHYAVAQTERTAVALFPPAVRRASDVPQPSNYFAMLTADSPVRYYRLDEPTGTITYDQASSHLDGTLHGGITLSQTGLLANTSDTAMLFNGTTGYISLPTTGLPTGTNPWTLEAWVRMTSVPNTGMHVIATFGKDTTNQAAVIALSSGNFVVNTYGGNTITGPAAVANTTYHVVGLYDGTKLWLYINGYSVGSLTCSPNVTLSYAYIGCENGTPTDFWSGVIDEPAMYSVALTPAQIFHHYLVGVSPTTSFALFPPLVRRTGTFTATRRGSGASYATLILSDNPQVYYRLDEVSGNTAYDLSGNGYNGTLSGGVTYGQPGAILDDSDTAMLFEAPDTLSLPYTINPSLWSALTLEFWINFSLSYALRSFGAPITYLSSASFANWQYVVVTVNAAATTLYLNGAVYSSGSGNEVIFDKDIYYGGSFQSATLDEVALYNYVMTANQIAYHYTVGTTNRTAAALFPASARRTGLFPTARRRES